VCVCAWACVRACVGGVCVSMDDAVSATIIHPSAHTTTRLLLQGTRGKKKARPTISVGRRRRHPTHHTHRRSRFVCVCVCVCVRVCARSVVAFLCAPPRGGLAGSRRAHLTPQTPAGGGWALVTLMMLVPRVPRGPPGKRTRRTTRARVRGLRGGGVCVCVCVCVWVGVWASGAPRERQKTAMSNLPLCKGGWALVTLITSSQGFLGPKTRTRTAKEPPQARKCAQAPRGGPVFTLSAKKTFLRPETPPVALATACAGVARRAFGIWAGF
jgi:hypothetical protein